MILLASFLATFSAQAALPPGAESLRRIAAIAQSPAVFQAVGSGGWVKEIRDTGNGLYEVISGNCVLPVTVSVVVDPHGPIGPGKLVVTPGRATCLPRP